MNFPARTPSPEESPSRLEPLPELARFTFDWAPVLCRPEHGCLTYHRGWSVMRVFGQAGASPRGWQFLHRELNAHRVDGPLRVMISGCADTGLMAIVAACFPDPATAQIVLAERCETTLQQNLLFARHLRRDVEFHPGDIRRIACEPVDAVIGHSFLNYFEEDERLELTRAWLRALKPGGIVLLSNRLAEVSAHPDAQDASPASAIPETVADDAPAEPLAALLACAAAHHWSGRDLERLETAAADFREIPPRRTVTEQAARQALEDAGFEDVRIEFVAEPEGGPDSPRRGKSKHRRANISARKPLS